MSLRHPLDRLPPLESGTRIGERTPLAENHTWTPRALLCSAATNWLAFFATLAIAFFLSPYLIRRLGDSTYGVWVFVESVLAYFTLLDLGVAACVVRYVARFSAKNETVELNRLVSTAFAVFLVAGGIVLFVGGSLTPLLLRLLGQTPLSPTQTLAFMVLMLANLAFTLPASLFPAILDGLNRYGSKSAVKLVFLALRTLAIVAVLENDGGLWEVGLVYTSANIAEHLVLVGLVFHFLPELRLSWRWIDRPTWKLVRSYSTDAFLAMLAGRITMQTAALVIGGFLTTPMITHFAIASRLVEFAKAILRSATTTLTPAISAWEASGNIAAIRSILLLGTRWVLYLVLPIHLGLILWGKSFLTIWLGDAKYASSCYPTLCILSLTLTLGVAQSIGSRILYGVGRLRWFARLALVEAAVNLGFSLWWVQLWGIEGVAWAIAVPNIAFCGYVVVAACRTVEVGAADYLWQGWFGPLLVASVPALLWSFAQIVPTVTTWTDFAWTLLIGLIPYGMLVLLVERELRERIKSRLHPLRNCCLQVMSGFWPKVARGTIRETTPTFAAPSRP